MSSLFNSDGSGFLYCPCMGQYSRCMECLLTFGISVVRGLWIVMVYCLAFIISTMAVKVFVNIREICQEVNKNFLPSDEDWVVSEDLLRCSPQRLLCHSWGSLSVKNCNLVRLSWARLPSPTPFSTFLRCQLLSCPGSTVVTPLLTHPHLLAFLSSTYCFPPSLLQNSEYPLGMPGVQSNPGSTWDPFSLLDWVIAVIRKGVLVYRFSTQKTHRCFLFLLLNMLHINV